MDKGLLGAQPGGSCSTDKQRLEFGQQEKNRRWLRLHCVSPRFLVVWTEVGVVLSVKPRTPIQKVQIAEEEEEEEKKKNC